MLKENKDHIPEIISSRVFDFPLPIVFNAWTDPILLAQWWGPKGFTNTFFEFDFAPGGDWVFTMHSPDGTSYQNVNRFTKIQTNERISFEHIEPVHTFEATACFVKKSEATLLIFSMQFNSFEEYEKVKNFIVVANEENFDRLETVLKNLK